MMMKRELQKLLVLLTSMVMVCQTGKCQTKSSPMTDSSNAGQPMTLTITQLGLGDLDRPLFDNVGNLVGHYEPTAEPYRSVESYRGNVTVNGSSFQVTSLYKAEIAKDNNHIILTGDLPANHRGGSVYMEVFSTSGEKVSDLNRICVANYSRLITTIDGDVIFFGHRDFGDNPPTLVKMSMLGEVKWEISHPNIVMAGFQQSPSGNLILLRGMSADLREVVQLIINAATGEIVDSIPYQGLSNVFIDDSRLFMYSAWKWKVVDWKNGLKELNQGVFERRTTGSEFIEQYLPSMNRVVLVSISELDEGIIDVLTVNPVEGIVESGKFQNTAFSESGSIPVVIATGNQVKLLFRKSIASIQFTDE